MFRKLYPKGKAWDFTGQADDLLEAKNDNFSPVKEFLKQLGLIFDPKKTIMLLDCEREYGLANQGQTEEIRRQRLAGAISMQDDLATTNGLEDFVKRFGFEINVYQNEYPTNPENFIEGLPLMTCGEPDATCGAENSRCGRSFGGELIINGKISGKLEIFAPPSGWDYVFFIGQNIQYFPSGEIESLDPIDIPTSRKEEFRSLILKYKPLNTWAILFANYT